MKKKIIARLFENYFLFNDITVQFIKQLNNTILRTEMCTYKLHLCAVIQIRFTRFTGGLPIVRNPIGFAKFTNVYGARTFLAAVEFIEFTGVPCMHMQFRNTPAFICWECIFTKLARSPDKMFPSRDNFAPRVE